MDSSSSGLVPTKVLAGFLAVALSLWFGFLPLLCATRCRCVFGELELAAAADDADGWGEKKNVFMAFLLNFGGGVLLANCFCHWLPEVREGNYWKIVPRQYSN